MKNIILIFSFQFFIVSCVQRIAPNNSLSNKGLEVFLNKDIVISLDSCVNNFDKYLQQNYKDVTKDKRVKKFLSNYSNSYLSDEEETFHSLVFSFNFFIKDIQLLESTGFFRTKLDIKNTSVIFDAQKWKTEILFEGMNFNIDSLLKKDSFNSFNFKNNRVGADFYYGINNLANKENDTLTKNWVNGRIITNGAISAVTYVRTLPNEYLNSTLGKIMVFTEFILPFYNFEKKEFELNPAPQSL